MGVFAQPLPQRAAPPLPDRRAAPPVARLPDATLLSRDDLTDSLAVFMVRLDAPLTAYLPGQYVSVGVFEGQQLVQRPYSIVSVDAGGCEVELFIRRVTGGALSSRLWSSRPGARIRVGPPRGLFTLDADDPRQRLFVCSGTGLAPFMAMLQSSAARADTTPVTLLHGASLRDELGFTRRIHAWVSAGLPVDHRPTISRPEDARNRGWSGDTGRVEAQLRRLCETGAYDPQIGVAYLCGNPDMISACAAVLEAAGSDLRDIHIERFRPGM